MDFSTLVLYGLATILFVLSLIKDRQKTKKALKKGWMAFTKILPVLIPLFLVVGVFLSLITPVFIKQLLGADSGILGVVTGMTLGSIAFMPPFVAYPLGVELIDNGAGYAQVAGFVTTLMAVGFVYWSAEVKFFGQKAVLYRNGLALTASGIVALIIGRIM